MTNNIIATTIMNHQRIEDIKINQENELLSLQFHNNTLLPSNKLSTFVENSANLVSLFDNNTRLDIINNLIDKYTSRILSETKKVDNSSYVKKTILQKDTGNNKTYYISFKYIKKEDNERRISALFSNILGMAIKHQLKTIDDLLTLDMVSTGYYSQYRLNNSDILSYIDGVSDCQALLEDFFIVPVDFKSEKDYNSGNHIVVLHDPRKNEKFREITRTTMAQNVLNLLENTHKQFPMYLYEEDIEEDDRLDLFIKVEDKLKRFRDKGRLTTYSDDKIRELITKSLIRDIVFSQYLYNNPQHEEKIEIGQLLNDNNLSIKLIRKLN